MALFRGLIEGNRGEASRLGSAASGLRVQADSWEEGVKVLASETRDHHSLDFELVADGGSNRRGDKSIGRLRYSRATGSSRLILSDEIIGKLAGRLSLTLEQTSRLFEGVEIRGGWDA